MAEFRESCTACGSIKGFKWHWCKNDGHSKGYSECLGWGKEFHKWLDQIKKCLRKGKTFYKV